MYKIFAVYIAVFGASFIGVALFRRWSLKREIVDVPNERSSHTVPTPRGGGVIIGLISILTFFIYSIVNRENLYLAYFVAASIVLVISLIDDIRELSPSFRIICHGLAAGLSVWAFGGFEWLWIPFYGNVNIGIWGVVIAFLWIVWLINAYNFMDGIDGIAATQSITAGIGWASIGFLLGIDGVGFYGGVLAASSFGFLLLNWQPAKIFMGDVGSAFLGYSFAVLPLLAVRKLAEPNVASILPWIGVLLVWFFVFDSFYTLLKRLLRGAKVWQPHREHIYQKLVIAGMSHSKVTSIYGAGAIILLGVLMLAMWNFWSFEKAVPATVLVETALLWVLGRIVLNNRKTL